MILEKVEGAAWAGGVAAKILPINAVAQQRLNILRIFITIHPFFVLPA
jgi:hypothetical protein